MLLKIKINILKQNDKLHSYTNCLHSITQNVSKGKPSDNDLKSFIYSSSTKFI